MNKCNDCYYAKKHKCVILDVKLRVSTKVSDSCRAYINKNRALENINKELSSE